MNVQECQRIKMCPGCGGLNQARGTDFDSLKVTASKAN